MDQTTLWEDIVEILLNIRSGFLEYLPRILGAVAIIVAGILIAYLIRAIVNRLIRKIHLLIPGESIRRNVREFLAEKPVTAIIGNILYWVTIFFFLAIATETLGLPVVTTWLGGLAGYLPRILSAVLIGMAGIVGGMLLRDLVITTTSTAGIAYGTVLAKIVQIVVLLVTALIAMDQIGLDVSLLQNVVITAIGALLFGGALAFGLGANSSVSNILTSYYLQRIYSVGDRVRIDGREGRIIEITPLAVILDTAEGQTVIPAKLFNQEASVLLTKEE